LDLIAPGIHIHFIQESNDEVLDTWIAFPEDLNLVVRLFCFIVSKRNGGT